MMFVAAKPSQESNPYRPLSEAHTFDPSCAHNDQSNTFTRRASTLSELPPSIKSQFFYISALPIDDPLSPLPTLSTKDSKTRSITRPFSSYDNAQLERAWQDLNKDAGTELRHSVARHSEPYDDREEAEAVEGRRESLAYDVKQGTWKNLDHINKIIQEVKDKKHAHGKKQDSAGAGVSEEAPHLEHTIAELQSRNLRAHSADQQQDVTFANDPNVLIGDSELTDIDHKTPMSPSELETAAEANDILQDQHLPQGSQRKEKPSKPEKKAKQSPKRSPKHDASKIHGEDVPYGSSPSERDTTGTPFVRAPDRRPRSSMSNITRPQTHGADADEAEPEDPKSGEAVPPASRNGSSSVHFQDEPYVIDPLTSEAQENEPPHPGRTKEVKKAYVPVGISRLHLVEMPDLQMKPIYWSPVHDISSVVRGTWFYKDSMLPVDSAVANQLEAGYEYMKPWTQTYEDELNSCLKIGAEAELKVVHRLWPADEPSEIQSILPTNKTNQILEAAPDPISLGDPEHLKASDSAAASTKKAAGLIDPAEKPTKFFARSSVIYADYRNAQILKATQLPSVARGRKPLAHIRKGRPVGMQVVRGFNQSAWHRLHTSKKDSPLIVQHAAANAPQAGTATLVEHPLCPACHEQEKRPKMTDLILVIHGIGQKLSERVESYNFTHSINSLRRQINVELTSEDVIPLLRKDLGGVMILPINWRSTVSFDDGGEQSRAEESDEHHSMKNEFTLKDITAETLPAVRGLISDVMLDIPYYLSHHKAKMNEAVAKEANRVYRLWCSNNPGFQETGRVHLIAHSLGSLMALDILSQQPTQIPFQLDFKHSHVHHDMFEFDTKSLFFCGSPAGFFLLLNKASLLPREDSPKLALEREGIMAGVTGKVGKFGCLAADNVYNIMHRYDPVAYRMNACVDVDLAASLKPAPVPTAEETWAETFGFSSKSKPRIDPASLKKDKKDPMLERPPISVTRLPSTLEMETHDFTREEIAERRMSLLNDNGQIDYYLSGGGGPLDIQYLNMLGAHSSYWVLRDFVRFVVLEVGRQEGKEGTLLGLRAVKKGRGKK